MRLKHSLQTTVFGNLLLGILVDEPIEEAHRSEIDQRIAIVVH